MPDDNNPNADVDVVGNDVQMDVDEGEIQGMDYDENEQDLVETQGTESEEESSDDASIEFSDDEPDDPEWCLPSSEDEAESEDDEDYSKFNFNIFLIVKNFCVYLICVSYFSLVKISLDVFSFCEN